MFKSRLSWKHFVIPAVLLLLPTARAADHADGTPLSLDAPDAAADITDLLTWMSPDAKTVNLVMDVHPNAVPGTQFSDAVKYVFHLTSKASFLSTTGVTSNVICTFEASQKVSCWVVDANQKVLDYVNGNASGTAGITSPSGRLRVFAGRRDDPFFFNFAGFRNATATVAQILTTFNATPSNTTHIKSMDMTNAVGCPTFAPGFANQLISLLQHDCAGNALANPPVTGGPAIDFFAKKGERATDGSGCVNQGLSGDILALVVTVDKSLVASSTATPILSVWASTNK
jgi:hypothetical protein